MDDLLRLKDVADRCGVSVESVREWIDRGLRAFPLGNATKYEPRDYLIREGWLLAFLEAQSTVRPRGKPEAPPSPARRPRRGVAGAGANPLGPCPA